MKINKTIYDPMNHNRLPKEILLPESARRDKQGTKGYRV